MKNINFYFGYMNQSKFSQITYKLCNKFKFLPSICIELFKTFHNSNKYFVIKHNIEIGLGGTLYRWEKTKFANQTKYSWRFNKIK